MQIRIVCPKCGYVIYSGKEDDYYELLSGFPDRIITILRNLYLEIEKELPSSIHYFKEFISNIKDCNPLVIERQVDLYLKTEKHRNGYGLGYLAKMITNYNTDFPNLVRNEKKKIGTIPPIRNISREKKDEPQSKQ
jgi:hypothetical protein